MVRVILILLFTTIYALSAPTTSWYLDELGQSSYLYAIDDDLGNNDGIVQVTPSVGHSNGKICSALDFRASSTKDLVVLEKDALDGTGDFTISAWSKQSSTKGKSLLSGARSDQMNEIIFWFTSDTRFAGHLDGHSYSIDIPSIADDKWHHLVWRRDGDQGCFFTDGVNRGCKVVTTKVLEIESLIMGQEQDSLGGGYDSGQDWEGIVDEFLIFKDEALSDSEIADLYNNQNSGKAWDGGTRSCETLSMDDYTDWHFDEALWNGSTDEVKDSHGSNHGIGYSVSPAKGKMCNAVDLRADGTSDYMKLGEASSDIIGDFTISVWNKGESEVDSNGLLSGANSSQDNELLFWMSSDTKFTPHLEGSTKNITVSSIDDGTWHHLVWRRLGHESCFFRDGNKEGCTDMGKFSPLYVESLILGQDQDNVGGGFSGAQDWEGLLDELLIFRRAFTDDEINDIYNNQDSGKNWDGGTRTCPATIMDITKDSCVISDPINLTDNPKRIPGATVRYAIEVKNLGNAKSNDVVVSDDVGSEFDETTISNLKIDGSHECDCLNPVSTSDNGDDGGVNENTVSLDFSTIDVSAVECGYFEVKIK